MPQFTTRSALTPNLAAIRNRFATIGQHIAIGFPLRRLLSEDRAKQLPSVIRDAHLPALIYSIDKNRPSLSTRQIFVAKPELAVLWNHGQHSENLSNVLRTLENGPVPSMFIEQTSSSHEIVETAMRFPNVVACNADEILANRFLNLNEFRTFGRLIQASEQCWTRGINEVLAVPEYKLSEAVAPSTCAEPVLQKLVQSASSFDLMLLSKEGVSGNKDLWRPMLAIDYNGSGHDPKNDQSKIAISEEAGLPYLMVGKHQSNSRELVEHFVAHLGVTILVWDTMLAAQATELEIESLSWKTAAEAARRRYPEAHGEQLFDKILEFDSDQCDPVDGYSTDDFFTNSPFEETTHGAVAKKLLGLVSVEERFTETYSVKLAFAGPEPAFETPALDLSLHGVKAPMSLPWLLRRFLKRWAVEQKLQQGNYDLAGCLGE